MARRTEAGTSTEDPWKGQLEALGAFIRAQRRLADLSLREMGALSKISNAYLSQIERGLHQPSVRVLRSIAGALGVPPEVLLAQAGLLPRGRMPVPSPSPSTGDESPAEADTAGAPSMSEAAILADPALSDEQRAALLAVYRSFVPRT